ncbi:MAG: hypothetical protein IJE54_01270 [Peptococcaceae bacterium]|nr:hypothetical protein [Peptococcaceae bacterium]MBQ3510256.1 hypothetical protein [Peptococcaceae bacterium]MBQ6887057.1 hypothetical protein [Lachnospiraceae bacterium]
MDKEKVLGTIKSATKNFANQFDNQYVENLDDSFYQGFDLCMLKMMNLLVDSNLKDAEIISLLQKHFDLRLSEAEDEIRTAKNRKNRNKEK